MGMFSFMCPVCNKAIISNEGSKNRDCVIFVKKDGKVVERQEGLYSGYDHVTDWEKMDWGDICDLMFDDEDGDGILAFHKRCFTEGDEIKFTTSEDDDDQGWNDPDDMCYGPCGETKYECNCDNYCDSCEEEWGCCTCEDEEEEED